MSVPLSSPPNVSANTAETKPVDLSGWGRFPSVQGVSYRISDERDVRGQVSSGPVIARGNGRSYGDSAAQPNGTLDMRSMSHMIDFDEETGILVAEAGVILGDVIAAFLPRGWFPPVTPGTKFVTLGGMIAADVHGKNHVRDGSIRRYIEWIDVMGADGVIRRASNDSEKGLFDWTVGGMGLTGVILRCAIRLMRVDTGWIRQETHVAQNLSVALDIFDENQSRYAVAWFDCLATGGALGRSIVMLGEHADIADLASVQQADPYSIPARRRLKVPFDAPGFALNRYSLRAFNSLYYKAQSRKSGGSVVDWESFFYPLDAILGWNRIYGRRGFAQYQVALPLGQSKAGLNALLDEISSSGEGSFLAVLKRLGPEEGPISFPLEGYTLALDFAVSDKVLALLERLDAITLEHGGRPYLAKDSRIKAATFHRADPRADEYVRYRKRTGAGPIFASLQSLRLKI